MDSQRAAWGSLGASQGSSRIFSRLGRAGCPWEKYIEDSAAAALSGSLARAQKKSSLQGLAGEVLTICRRGCFHTLLWAGSDRAPAVTFRLLLHLF